MNQRFQNAEIRLVAEQYADNELYKAVSTIGQQLESELPEFGLCPEECFMEVLELLTSIADRGEDILPDVDNMWLRKSNEYRRLARQVERVNEEEIDKVVGIVFGFTILALDSSMHPFYRYRFSERLMYVIANHKFVGWSSTLERIFSVPLPDGWFDSFIDEDTPKVLSSSSRNPKTTKQKKAGEKKTSIKPKTLKYLCNVNNGTRGQRERRLNYVFQFWQAWGWIDANVTSEDFSSLFEGSDRNCNFEFNKNMAILTLFLRDFLAYKNRKGKNIVEHQTNQSPTSIVKEQFHKTASFDSKRLTDTDNQNIDLCIYTLDTANIAPSDTRGHDIWLHDNQELLQLVSSWKTSLKEQTEMEVKTGQLRRTKGI